MSSCSMSSCSMSSSSTTSTTLVSSHKPADHKAEKISPEKCRLSFKTPLELRLCTSALEALQTLTALGQKKSKACLTKVSALNTGAYYPDEYYALLEKMLKGPFTDTSKKQLKERMERMTTDGSFYHGIAPKKTFESMPCKQTATGLMPCAYVLKNSTVLPSQALMSILEDQCLIFIDCRGAIQIAYYKALLDVLGQEKFDYLFAADGPIPFTLGPLKNVLLKFLTKTCSSLKDGCWLYKSNTTYYADKHVNGLETGFHLLYIDKHYFGFGLETTGKTGAELDQFLMACYNTEPKNNEGLSTKVSDAIQASLTSTQIATLKERQVHKISIEEYLKTGGGKIHVIRYWNIDLIQGIIAFDKVSARKLFDKD